MELLQTTRNERIGLVLLLGFTLVGGLLLYATSGGGATFGNIFTSMVAYGDQTPAPDVEAQLEPFKQPLGLYVLFGMIAAGMAMLAFSTTAAYIALRKRVPRTWALFLMVMGAVLMVISIGGVQLEAQITGLPIPADNAARAGLLVAIDRLEGIGIVGGVLVAVALGMLIYALVWGKRSPANTEELPAVAPNPYLGG
jgi:hypothetical protein